MTALGNVVLSSPVAPPLHATIALEGKFAYRVCRKGEDPWNLRRPALQHLDFSEKRQALIVAIALGNSLDKTSPFLYSTKSLKKALKIVNERKHRYINWLVRWPLVMEGVDSADFSIGNDKAKWLNHFSTDSGSMASLVSTARGYVTADAEVVFFDHTGQRNVEYWDEIARLWRDFRIAGATSAAT